VTFNSVQKPRRPKPLNINGWINLDKPAGVTSTDMVTAVKRALNAAKAGHAGTLDPLATGILPIALGEATKTLYYVTDTIKGYTFTIQWGEARDTDDAEGKPIATSDTRPDDTAIRAALPAFIGNIMQLPPKFSALKINGERAYDLARAGTEFTLEPRPVHIESLELIATTPDTATLTCVCGKGTYVRSIARDLAEKLGTKGYISALRRTRVGCFTETTAISLAHLREIALEQPPQAFVLSVGQALDDIPALTLTQPEAVRIKSGNAVDLVSRLDVERLTRAGLDPRLTNDTLVLAKDGNGHDLALLSVTGPRISPVRVFNL
jgi:tRNA pseudouridine55 synthase